MSVTHWWIDPFSAHKSGVHAFLWLLEFKHLPKPLHPCTAFRVEGASSFERGIATCLGIAGSQGLGFSSRTASYRCGNFDSSRGAVIQVSAHVRDSMRLTKAAVDDHVCNELLSRRPYIAR